LALSVLALDAALFAQSGQSSEHWVGSWATALVGRAPDGNLLAGIPSAPPAAASQTPAASTPPPPPPSNFNNQTLPQIVHTSIGVYLPGSTTAGTSPLSTHTGALQTSYASPSGNHTGVVTMPVMTTTTSWFFLARVEVTAPEQVGAVVTIGDSITDGSRSTVD